MRALINYFLFVTVFCSLNGRVTAQTTVATGLAVLNSINENYRSKQDFIIEMNYAMDRLDNGKPLDNISGVFKKKGEHVFFKLGDFETACEGNFNISVDNFNKVIFISDPVVFNALNLGDITQDVMDKVFVSAEIKDLGKGDNQLILMLKNGGVEKVEVIYNKESLLLKKVTSWYNRPYQLGNDTYPVKITVTYLNHKENSGVSSKDFPAAKYITPSNNTYNLKPAYNGYKLYDKTTKTGNL